MNDNVAFLELKYGNIYGGYPNFYAISEASLLVFEHSTNRIFLETMTNTADIDIVSVYSKVDVLGNTIGKVREVLNLRTGNISPYDETHMLKPEALDKEFEKIRPTRRFLKGFLMKKFAKYRVNNIVTFDGRRDIFLCEKANVRFDRMKIFDIQKAINKETNYLFSLNKLAVVTGFDFEHTRLKSNNLEYRLHPIASKQIRPKSAAYDAARLLMVYQEFNEHHEDFFIKAALLLNKIERTKV